MKRQPWVNRHNPIRTGPDDPLSVGNGHIAFTADVTGLQSLRPEEAGDTPLCTLADWGWHTAPAPTPGGRWTLADVKMEAFSFQGREVHYARTCYPENEAVYHWLRQNPHRMNLARIGFRYQEKALESEALSALRQELRLYDGLLESRFTLEGTECRVLTACAPDTDTLAFQVHCPLLTRGLSVELAFPYGSPDITASDWTVPERHRTELLPSDSADPENSPTHPPASESTVLNQHRNPLPVSDGGWTGIHPETSSSSLIRREADDLVYFIRVCGAGFRVRKTDAHRIQINSDSGELSFSLSFQRNTAPQAASPGSVFLRSRQWWNRYWETGAMLDLSASADPRAMELERRIVLSLYLLAINSCGAMPPAETGLTCNSWYGKAHLEMHFWHIAWAPLWGHGELLERSLPWYTDHLPEARENATRNGYRGARWPKMVAEDAQDSPSPIAVLLIWQQPHILTLLFLRYRSLKRTRPDQALRLLREYSPLIRETADFMADYAVMDEQGICHLEPPCIPVQERYDPRETRDPAFEVAYWKFGLEIAVHLTEQIGETPDPLWRKVAAAMADPPVFEGLYIAHAGATDTFTEKLDDHPSMLQCLGLLPGHGMDPAIMLRTLATVRERWDETSLWGWDFAVMAMTALRLGDPKAALDLLLKDTPKNTFTSGGHNRQPGRSDLPLYLPGNGSLLLACAMMAAGWDGSEPHPGFRPEDGWTAQAEGLLPWL